MKGHETCDGFLVVHMIGNLVDQSLNLGNYGEETSM